MRDAIIEWLANGETGLSSETIAFFALGKTNRRISYPYDPADLNRCIKLLTDAPEAKKALPILANLNPTWKRLVQHWEELQQMFIDEVGYDWCNAKSAPKTYGRM